MPKVVTLWIFLALHEIAVVTPDVLVAGLKAMQQLTALHLSHPLLTSDHLSSVLPVMTSLQTLELYLRSDGADHLAFLQSVAGGLRRLELSGVKTIRAGEAHHLEALQRLEHLVMGYRLFDGEVDATFQERIM
jgi:hypothetical protein